MSDTDQILRKISGPLPNFVAPESHLYWVILLSAALIAFLVYWFGRDQNEDASSRSFLRFCFPRHIYRHPSALLDFRYFAINTVVYGAFIGPLLWTSSTTALG